MAKSSGHIVVGVDFSAPSTAAARWTARHVVEQEDLVLAHAICIPEPPGFLKGLYPPVEPLIEDARRGAEARLRELGESLGVPRVSQEVHVGRPDEVLAEVTKRFGAELLVIGPHGDRPGIGKLLGGTAERLARVSPASVLLARGLPAGAPRVVLVALEESVVNDALLAWTVRFARRSGATVVAMHVVNPLLAGAAQIGAAGSERRRVEEQLRHQAEEWLSARLAGTALEQVATEVAFGYPGFEIMSAADRLSADLIVVGRSAPGRGRSRDIGGTASFILRNGSGSVLLVAPSAS